MKTLPKVQAWKGLYLLVILGGRRGVDCGPDFGRKTNLWTGVLCFLKAL